MNVKVLCKLTSRLCLCCSYDLGHSALHLWAESSLSSFLLPELLVGAVAVRFLRRETVHLPNTPPPQLCCEAKQCGPGPWAGGPLCGVREGSECPPQHDWSPGPVLSRGKVTSHPGGKTTAPPLEFLAPLLLSVTCVSPSPPKLSPSLTP